MLPISSLGSVHTSIIVKDRSTANDRQHMLLICHSMYPGGIMIGPWTHDSKRRRFVSRPSRFAWASFSHTYATVTKQYNLVPVERRRPATGKVTVGMALHWQ